MNRITIVPAGQQLFIVSVKEIDTSNNTITKKKYWRRFKEEGANSPLSVGDFPSLFNVSGKTYEVNIAIETTPQGNEEMLVAQRTNGNGGVEDKDPLFDSFESMYVEIENEF